MKKIANDVFNLDLFRKHQIKKNDELSIKLDSVIANQELLFMLVKKLADCFQLEYENGKYISKRKAPK